MKKRFIAFLKEHGAYRRYLSNFRLNRKLTYKVLVSEYSPEDWINEAFLWADTRQGDKYWRNLCHLWSEIIANYCNDEV